MICVLGLRGADAEQLSCHRKRSIPEDPIRRFPRLRPRRVKTEGIPRILVRQKTETLSYGDLQDHMEIYKGFILSRSCSFPVFNRKHAVSASVHLSAAAPAACVLLRNAAHWVPATSGAFDKRSGEERRFYPELRAVASPGGRPIVDDPRLHPYLALRWKRLVGSFPELAARSCARTGENPCVRAAPLARGPVAVAAPARTLRDSDRS
jgi:hypothetical protein